MGLLGILVALGLLIWLAYRGWSVLLLAPAAAILAAGLAGEPLLAHWTHVHAGCDPTNARCPMRSLRPSCSSISEIDASLWEKPVGSLCLTSSMCSALMR